MELKVKRLTDKAKLPTYATDGSGCFDFYATDYDYVPKTGSVIGTGLSFEIPKGNVLLIFSRSGHGFNHDIRLANCVGVIDSDYRGEVKIKLANDNLLCKAFNISPGDRIAQGLVIPYDKVDFIETDSLEETERGEGGLGSTG